MKNPYFIDEPAAVISFSGGRTSAYMLYKILEAHGGLPDNLKVIFANTGKEAEQTLQFVHDCSVVWGVGITWVEYMTKKSHKSVSIETASRAGEPFDQLTTDRSYLPNMIARFCTSELKVLPIEREMRGLGFDEFSHVVGIRADEPRRAAKMRAKDNYIVPLADDGISEREVLDFWRGNSFDLDLPIDNNLYSNCDLCFLKGGSIKKSIIREQPSRADWWVEQEKKIGGFFRSDQPSYEQMKIIATDQGQLFDFPDDETIPCFCGD